jgi:hypothetical protein
VKVLNTPELLEAILSEMPIHEVLLSQRVASIFNATISSSPTLQKALFFSRIGDISTRKDQKKFLLLRHKDVYSLFDDGASPSSILAGATRVAKRGSYLLNPLIFSLFPTPSEGRFTYDNSRGVPDNPSSRGMLLMQPPVRSVRLVRYGEYGYSVHRATREVKNEFGVTLGDVEAMLHKMRPKLTTQHFALEI